MKRSLFLLFLFLPSLLSGCQRSDGPTSMTLANDVPGQKTTRLRGAFIAFHLEVKTETSIEPLWPRLEQFMALADQYDHAITLQFSWPWASFVFRTNRLSVVQGWEKKGHEIALHHHGPSHKFFDGYTNAPERIRPANWYSTNYGYLGNMRDLMNFLAPLSGSPIRSAGMSDEDTDWPEGVRYFATDSEDGPSRDDILSRPVRTVHNGYEVIEIYNAGYEIDHLGSEAVRLSDVEDALRRAGTEDYMGLVFNDETIQEDFDKIEPLFQLLAEYGVKVKTVSTLLSEAGF